MNIAESYDAIPYESTPLPDTHPGHLACLARLYGVEATPPTACRVLELGCASGGNLIPMAARLPGSRFLGIELSPLQAREGAARVAELGLTNCEIRQADLLDLQDEGLRFDYIVTHGVYSWSPPEVRARIMDLSSQLLGPRGIAYISYNSYPGWRMRGMLRDMLLHRVRDIQAPLERLHAAREYLDFLEAGLEELEAASVSARPTPATCTTSIWRPTTSLSCCGILSTRQSNGGWTTSAILNCLCRSPPFWGNGPDRS
jgi:SAM-dependent methyltransferase